MKRDMDLVRTIVRAYEGEPAARFEVAQLEGGDEGRAKVDHHEAILEDAGYLCTYRMYGAEREAHGGQFAPMSLPTRLTWQGHEFLAAMQDDSLWEQAKQIIKPGMSWTTGLLFEWLKSKAKEKMHLPP